MSAGPPAAGPDLLERAVVRVHDRAGAVIGAGFLVGDRLVCTCAHIVAAATGSGPADPEPPAEPVTLDFPLLRPGEDQPGRDALIPARVHRWDPQRDDDTGDIALLQLQAPAPDGAKPVPLAPDGAGWEHAFRAFGFPQGRDHGVWVTGRMLGRQGAGWVQLEVPEGPRIARGFSGAPVWDEDAGGVVGMVVAAERGATTAYLIPSALLLEMDPELSRAAAAPRPYRGLEPFREEDARFFFGRDDAVGRLASLVEQHDVVVVSGPSGSGKSSLVRAGLWPRLRDQGVACAEFRPIPEVTPRKLLAHALARVLGTDWTGELTEEDLLVLAGSVGADGRRVVLLCDQFEELVAADPAKAQELFRLARKLTEIGSSGGRPAPLRVVVTVRSAVLDELLTAEFAHVLETASLYLPPMTPAELEAAVTGPARVASVSFEPGLVSRILEDARGAPGQLPHLQFALTRLWDARRGGVLTHAAYDGFGGLGGVVAAYTEDVVTNRLSDASRTLTERLLVQLARPAEEGTFTAAPVPLEQLDPELRTVAAELSAYRLVVIRQDPGQPAVVALAHEALVREWPRLRDWLRDAQEFRRWQEQLRATLDQWERSGSQDAGALLSGPRLSVAEEWLARRPQGVTPPERRYVEASRRQQRRGTRLRRTVAAVIAALLVAASAAVGVAYNQSQERAQDLRRQAAVPLARESQAKAGTNSLSAIQFAQAAWRHDPTSDSAYTMLLKQYVRFATAEEIRPIPWVGAVADAAVSNDGKTVALLDQEDGVVAVMTGLLEGTPSQPWEVTSDPRPEGIRMSGNGRWLAVRDEHEGVSVWDIRNRTGPHIARPPNPPARPRSPVVSNFQFSPDGERLVMTAGQVGTTQEGGLEVGKSFIEVWDTRLQSTVQSGFATSDSIVRVRHVTSGGQRAWFYEFDPASLKLDVRLRDLTTGKILSTIPEDATGSRDALVALAEGGELTVWDGATGKRRLTMAPPPPNDVAVDATGRYAILLDTNEDNSMPLVILVDLETGDAYRVQAPLSSISSTSGSPVIPIVTASASGQVTLFALEQTSLIRYSPADRIDNDFGALPDTLIDGAYDRSPDGRLLVAWFNPFPSARWGEAGLQVFDLESQKRLHLVPPADLRLAPRPRLTFTTDGKRLVAVGADGKLHVISVPDLTVERAIELPVAPEVRGDLEPGLNTSIISLPGSEVAVLHVGMFSFWDAATGRQTGEPLPLRPDFDFGLFPAGDDSGPQYPLGGLRPGFPHQALVLTPSAVEVWDLDKRRRIETFPLRASHEGRVGMFAFAGTAFVGIRYGESAVPMELWYPERDGDDERTPLPIPSSSTPLGMTPDRRLITQDLGSLTVWNLETGTSVTSLTLKDASWLGMGSRGTDAASLVGVTGTGVLKLDMDPDHWFKHLCKINNRGYTDEEREVLPEGADPTPPCETG